MSLLNFKQQPVTFYHWIHLIAWQIHLCGNFATQHRWLGCCCCSDTLCDMGAVEQLVGMLSMEHRPFHEQLIVALYRLVADNKRARAECLRPEFTLKSLLLDRKHSLEGKEEFQVYIDLFSFLQFCTFLEEPPLGMGYAHPCWHKTAEFWSTCTCGWLSFTGVLH